MSSERDPKGAKDRLTIEPEADAQAVEAEANERKGPVSVTGEGRTGSGGLGLRRLRADAEIHAISQALERTGWNRRRAAELLSISYRGLLYKIRQYDITSASTSQLSSLPQNAKAE